MYKVRNHMLTRHGGNQPKEKSNDGHVDHPHSFEKHVETAQQRVGGLGPAVKKPI
jgi:hypothetical protein